MAYVDGQIIFSKLKGFPVLSDESKIQTQSFIDAAKEIVALIAEFGALFTPVVYDMNGNIEKILKAFAQDSQRNYYLEDLLLHELKVTGSPLFSSLLWLKRALDLLEQFFRNVLTDTTKQESLKDHLHDAYVNTLKPYHGFIVQTAFSVVYRFISNRSQLIGNQEENLQSLATFLDPLRSHLNRINAFYTEHNLDDQYKVNSI